MPQNIKAFFIQQKNKIKKNLPENREIFFVIHPAVTRQEFPLRHDVQAEPVRLLL